MSKKIFTIVIKALLLSLMSCGNSNIGKPYPENNQEEVAPEDNEESEKPKTTSGNNSTKKSPRQILLQLTRQRKTPRKT